MPFDPKSAKNAAKKIDWNDVKILNL